MDERGLSLIEVMVALVIVGSSVVTLFYRGTELLENAQESVLRQEAMHIAETTINEIYIRGYTFYEEQGYLPEEEIEFDIEADFSAEEILLSSVIPPQEREDQSGSEREAEDEEEEKIVIVRIKVKVISKENRDVSVSLALDFPADTADVEGLEAILPDTSEK